MAEQDKALIASSEFNPAPFIAGIDAMTESLKELSAQEDIVKKKLTESSAALTANKTALKETEAQIAQLDKTSKTYQQDLQKLTETQNQLRTNQKELQGAIKTTKTELAGINQSANNYKTALQNLNAVAKQVSQENKGRSLFDVVNLNKQVQQITAAAGNFRNIFQGKIDTSELDRLEAELAKSGDEFKNLGTIIDFVEDKLKTLDPNTQEFEELNQVVTTGREVLEAYGQTQTQTEGKTKSLRGRLNEMRTALVQMEEAGLDTTEEFQKLQVEAGKLADQIGDAQQRIKILSSDTKNLDFGIAAIRGVAGAFGLAEGAAALFGVKNEDLQESIQRLNAIMVVLNGLQEIQLLLQKESIVAVVGQDIATKTAAVGQAIYAGVVGTSTGALKAFRLALLATGIGVFIVLIGLAAEAMASFGDETEKAVDQNLKFNESLESTIAGLESFNRFARTSSAIREEQLKRQGASEKTLQENRIKGLEEEKIETQRTLAEIRAAQEAFLNSGESGDFIEKSNQEATALFNRIMDLDDQIRIDKEKNLTRTFEDNKKALEKQRQLYEDYLKRLLDLQRELRDKLLEAQPQDEAAIRQSFKNGLDDALTDLDKEVSEGKLTKGRARILSKLINQINEVDLDAALKQFREEAIKAEDDLQNTIEDLRLRNSTERAEAIRDNFTREAAILEQEALNQRTQLIRQREEILKGINDTRDAGLISPAAAEANAARISQIYDQLLENLATQTAIKADELAFNTFGRAQELVSQLFAPSFTRLSEATTAEIQKVTELFITGQLRYDQYQKRVTQILKDEQAKRLQLQLTENEQLLQGVQRRIAAESDPERLEGLRAQEQALRNELASLRRQIAAADAEGEEADDAERGERIQKIAKFASAIGSITDQVVQFWSRVNEAEQKSLEKSISIQEERVEAAVRIAEKGNAEYLRIEEDRLNELRIKQENAARRQLAINAVLQTSQALVAFTSALAQGITTGGPLGGIAIAASVLGLIGAGFAIIQSLQANNTQRLFKGTKKVERGNNPDGIDTVPAMLTAGEAVIPKDKNQDYEPTIAAIMDGTISSAKINDFVKTQTRSRRQVPGLAFDAMAQKHESASLYNGRLVELGIEQNKRLEATNEQLAALNKSIKGIGVSVKMDREGIAIGVMEAVNNQKIQKKV